MQPSPKLFDRNAVLAHRARTPRDGCAMFLHEIAALEVQERLIDVNRTFKSVAIVTGHPAFWSTKFPEAVCVSDSETLELEPDSHDLVIHAMALHWANDPVGQLAQSRIALCADGLMIAVMLGGQTLVELRAALGEAEVSLKGGLSPRISPMGEIRDLGALLQRAGLALPVADGLVQTASYASLLKLMHDLRAMGEANALADRNKTFLSRDLITEAARIYSDSFSDADGRINATFELIFLTGWKPDASQQQPLKPGSAKARLADALGTSELGQDAKPVKGDEEQ